MRTDIKLVRIPEKLKIVLGEPAPGTHHYQAFGLNDDLDIWVDVFLEAVPENGFSPGGAASYVGVSRTAVHKRIKEGRLSAFSFYSVTRSIFSKNKYQLKHNKKPSMCLIPMTELQQWKEIIDTKKRKKKQLNVPTTSTDNDHTDVWATPQNWREMLNIKK